MSDAVRTRTLTVGPLAFTALEVGAGPLVLLLHGFPDGPETFSPQLAALAASGFHAVAPTLRGYEPSSRPTDGNYRLAALAADVTGWMDALGAPAAHLIGHDWGATIAYAAAVAAPGRVLSLTMIAVPHPLRLAEAIRADRAQRRRSGYIFFFQVRGGADWWVRRRRAAFVARLWSKWSPGWSIPPALIGRVRERFGDHATVAAALAYYRQALDARSDQGRASAALLAGAVRVRTLGLCGERDDCIGADVFRRSMRDEDFPGGVETHALAGTGHFVHAEAPDAVNALLTAHLGRASSSITP